MIPSLPFGGVMAATGAAPDGGTFLGGIVYRIPIQESRDYYLPPAGYCRQTFCVLHACMSLERPALAPVLLFFPAERRAWASGGIAAELKSR
jgi:hypothetical protein